jgi:hypothetical protein
LSVFAPAARLLLLRLRGLAGAVARWRCVGVRRPVRLCGLCLCLSPGLAALALVRLLAALAARCGGFPVPDLRLLFFRSRLRWRALRRWVRSLPRWVRRLLGVVAGLLFSAALGLGGLFLLWGLSLWLS